MMFSLLALNALSASGWRSTYYEDVRLHREGPVVAVQVAWNEPAHVTTESSFKARVSVFSGSRGHRRLLASTKVADLSSYGWKELLFDQPSSEAFLTLTHLVDGRLTDALYIFDDFTPRRIRVGSYFQSPTSPRRIVQSSHARDEGYEPPKSHYPDPPIESILTFEPKKRVLLNGPWHEVVFNPPATGELRGRAHGHTYRVQLKKTNFRLGSRRIDYSETKGLLVDGIQAWGADPSPDMLKSKEYRRQLFLTELTTFRAWIDGRELRIPPSIWKTLFSPNLDPGQYLFAWISKNGKSLKVKMLASDGAGSYTVIWTLRTNGHHTRTVESNC